jgi:hypothetical protein
VVLSLHPLARLRNNMLTDHLQHNTDLPDII